MKLAAHVEDFPPEQDRIHLANGTLMLDGTFTAVSYTHLQPEVRKDIGKTLFFCVKQHLRLPKAASVQGKGHSPNT